MIVYTHEDCLKKFNGNGHPERKERLESIINSIKSSNLKLEFREAPLVFSINLFTFNKNIFVEYNLLL